MRLAMSYQAMRLNAAHRKELLARDRQQETLQREMEELHSANSRIAVLAFTTAGVTEEMARVHLAEILKPAEGARQAREELTALQLKHEAMLQELGGGRDEEWREQLQMATEQTVALSQQVESLRAALAREQDASAAAQREADSLRADLKLRTAELDEVTNMLIHSKVNQAELNGDILGTKKDLVAVKKQVEAVSPMVSVQAERYPVSAKGKAGGVTRRESFPASSSKHQTEDKDASSPLF